MLDRAIIDHASPTLARLKLGNLFNYPMSAGFDAEFADLRALLAGKGVALSVLRKTREKALVYIYQRLFASGCPLSRLTVAARPA